MALTARLRTDGIQTAGVGSRRYRRILVAVGVTCATSAILLGLITFIRWRGRQALRSDTHATITQAGQQLVRALQSRRGTLTFIRDTLNRRSDLSLPQLQAMGASATEHTRHLVGTGLVRSTEQPVWWSGAPLLSRTELTQLNRAIVERTQLGGVQLAGRSYRSEILSCH